MEGFDNKVTQFIYEQELLPPGSRVLIACSGGVDSMVLLHYLATHQEMFSIEIASVYVDHMLRGQSSVEDGRLVQSFSGQKNIPFYSKQIPIRAIINEEGGNIQSVCRQERYQFFNEVMVQEGYDFLATGHHADDQLETVLMQLTKGNVPLGMPQKRRMKKGWLIRPLLHVDKSTLYQYAKKFCLPFREDASNTSDDYMRNRFRHAVIPHMMKENEMLIETITPLTMQLQEDEKFLQGLAEAHIQKHVTFTEEGHSTMNVKSFQSLPASLQRRLILLLLNYLYENNDEFIHLKSELIDLILHHLRSNEGSVSIDLPLNFQFSRAYDEFTFSVKTAIQKKQLTLPKGQKVNWDDQTWFYWDDIVRVDRHLLLKAKDIAFFNLPSPSLPLKVRQWQEGDRINLKGMSNSKRLSRLFIDEKISRNQRRQLPIIVTSDHVICAVPSVRYSNHFTKQQKETSKYIFVHGKN